MSRHRIHVIVVIMGAGHWTFLSNHCHVLVAIAREPGIRVRDIAGKIGLTERGVQRIISELEDSGYVSHRREGRRNVYRIRLDRELRHDLEADVSLRSLLASVVSNEQLDAVAQQGSPENERDAEPKPSVSIVEVA